MSNYERWQVRVHQSHTNGAKNPKCRWVVDPPGFDYKRRARHTGDWHRAGGKWFQWDNRYVTKREAWQEALAYADTQARTVTVTLPRGVEKVHLGPNAWTELRSDGGASVHGGCGSTGIRKYALERTALALLAHARRSA